MPRTFRLLAIAVGVAVLVASCSRTPYTRRAQYNLIPDPIINSLGQSTYVSMLGEVRVASRGADSTLLDRVGQRIARVANQPRYDWEFSLIQDDQINAWALPGGKIGFYTGILPVLQNEAGMAFVMGHEVGHATARHGAERMTQQLTMIGGLSALEMYLANESSLRPEQRGLILGALGVGLQVGVMLPFSRSHEAEADIIGMMYMANAGYPPAESIRVWGRMEEATGGSAVPAFLRTHPPNTRRQENLREWLPRARKRFERNALPHDTRVTLWGSGQGSEGARRSGRSGGSDRSRGSDRSQEERRGSKPRRQ